MSDPLVFRHQVTYNEASLLLFLICLEISSLLNEIRNQSPDASKYALGTSFLIPQQIHEATKDFTGFVKMSIMTIANRQEALNEATTNLDKIENYKTKVEGAIANVLQNQGQAPENALDDLYLVLDKLRDQEDKLYGVQSRLTEMSKRIDLLIQQHAAEWRDHYKKYAGQVIGELEKTGIKLNDLEKGELLNPKKNFSEIAVMLQKIGIIEKG